MTVYGDFFGRAPVEELAAQFEGSRYHPDDLQRRLNGIDVADYFGNLSNEAFLDLLYGADE